MEKAKSALRRAAALLAALCLAASMTLPVYAEGAEAADTTAIVEQADTIETPTPEGNTTEPQDAEATPTPEPTAEPAAEPTITPEPTAEPTAEPTITPEITAEPTAEPTITPEPTHTPEPTITPTPDEDAADDADEAETALVKQINDYSALYSARETIPDSCTLYLAVNPNSYKEGYTIKLFIQKGTGSGASAEYLMPMVDTNSTKDGQKIYSLTITKGSNAENAYGEDGKVYRILFQYFDGKEWKAQDFGLGGNDASTTSHSITEFADKLYDGDSKQWQSFSLATIYAGQAMQFQNKTDTELQNVTAAFYKKGDNGEYQLVGTVQDIGNVAANTTVRGKITIPEGDCAYVQFKAGDDVLGKDYYNFRDEGKESETVGKFAYKAGETSCFIYNGTGTSTWGVPGTPPGYVRVYFDASLSHLAYTAQDEIDVSNAHAQLATKYGMPGDESSQQLHCWIETDEGGTGGEQLPLFKDTTTTTASSRELWYVDIPKECKYINFAAGNVSSINDIHGNGITTGKLKIPDDKVEPCFFADSSDDVIYKQNQNQPRGGYWGKKDSVRNAAEGKKGTPVVDITKKQFQNIPGIKYIGSTLYDYYTDYELNGNNRDNYETMPHDDTFKQQRNWVTFRQFDRTVSDYYNAAGKTNKPNYPIYTGHFQSDEAGAWPLFSNLADALDLYGWAKSGTDKAAYRKFMATNNSNLDAQPFGNGSGKYSYTMLGLVANQLSGGTSSGNLLMSGTTDLLEPHFNEAFLKGDNSRNAKIGEVYHNVLFPFTKNNDVFADQPGVDYWWFDSSKTSLYMRQDPNTKDYYLGNKNTDSGKITTDSSNCVDEKSQNVNAISKTDYNITTKYGFFPFNETAGAASAEKYNFGFGAKLEIPFSLTADGQVQDEAGKDQPIRFYFSGDDDVWVYIDGQLALDIGGAHGKVSGILDFGDADKDGKVKVYVSRVKKNAEPDSRSYGDQSDDTGDDTGKGKKLSIRYVGDSVDTDYYYSTSVNIPNLTTGTHTLTMFYMERGMWESNMAVAYNFPDHNELQVEKEVDLTDVATEFKSVFEKSQQKLFTVNIRNWATHYAKLEKTGSTSKVNSIKVTDFTSAYYGDGKVGDTSTNFLKRCTTENQYPPGESKTDNETTVYWYAKTDDTSSQWRNKRLGQIALNDTIDISQMDFLTFQLYAVGGTINGSPVGTLGMKGLYLQLADENGNVMGCIGQSNNLENKTLGTVITQNDCWVTIKLSLDELRKHTQGSFDLTKVKYIRIGDDYERYIYFRNFTFSAKPGAGSQVGFAVKQYAIDDYGSVDAKGLVNAEGALFSSDKTDGMQAVDENGQFNLQNHETVTFTDQFRRGSYISLQELVDSNIYSTQWAIYENGKLVDNAKDGSTAWGAPKTALQGDNTTPDDNRTEYYINGADADSKEMSNNGYATKQRPQDTNAIVFRSYSNPDDTNQFTKLKVVFTNKVKVGTLVIKKTAPKGESLPGDYTFNITFSNIGGIGGSEVVMKRTVAVGSQTEITGIPVGTRFAISEVSKDGVTVKNITVTGDGSRVVDGTAYGMIAAENTGVTATFENTAQELIDISLTKNWKNADETTLTEGLPDCIYLQLQRSADEGQTWTSVPGYDKVKLEQDIYTVTWGTTFTKLDKFDVSQTNKPQYQYRVVEGTLSENGGFVPAADGEIQLGNYKYTISTAYTKEDGVQDPNSLTGGGSITITNTRQKPKYKLDITKQGIDGENASVLLSGVEFTLEVKGTNGLYTAVTDSTQITDDNGKCSFTELEPGSYRLTEVKTAEGYNLLAEPIEFVLTDKGQCTLVDGTPLGTVTGGAAKGYTIALTINNRKGLTLPHTGADAPSLWVLIGLPLLVAGLLVLVFRYNRKGGKRS